ncbi:ATP-binding protein [Kitasatospora sp. NPDC001547]|uniref:HD domain-containing protein n=1 Tax=Kitasatospora sp. NPDC001547 TaxID=3364015 RepID=UPI0036BCF5FB
MVDNTTNAVNGAVTGPVVQAGSIGAVYLDGSWPPAVPEGADHWVRAAAESRVWKHVREDRDVEPYRRVVLTAVSELAVLRDSVDLADDPWQDPGIAERFASRVDWLLGNDRLDLYPAEAALLAVLPFLYRVRSLRLAAARVSVAPTDLLPSSEPDTERAAYEQFTESYDLLVGRTRTRPNSTAPLGWWLYHRWLDQYEDLADADGVREILDRLPVLFELGETFTLKRVCALLHGLRRGPDVGNRDYLANLSADDHLRAPGEQHVREPRLALLLALAYGTAVEMTALPEIVAEHLGIPEQYEVDLVDLRRTLELAVWGGSYDLPVLRAECHHEAVVEGLREYTARADELLHAVRRVLTSHPLPTRLTSDEAVPAAGAFTGWARFRLDERRVRSLLMGVELYRDRDLAVRELYQNALDACRYRRARTEYLDRTNPIATFTYEGRIEFRQGLDEDGRAYLECQDNGVGMGEEELRGVFSNAGARFAEQLDFKLERAEWRKVDPPVELYPNSRFGIGVLSYFMLADEIRVTTCRMHVDGSLGPQLEVSIYGPSHLFRIAERNACGRQPGTTVRLYLRDDVEMADSWSCVDVLERLLAVAEFSTAAVHADRQASWEPGVLKTREAPKGETFGFNASGRTTCWAAAPDRAQVTWCEHGGALLVDGLVVEPEVVRGVVSPGGLSGAVVNLSGRLSPTKLSVDRRRVISDVSEAVRGLLEAAVGEFVSRDSAVLSMEWIHRVTEGNYDLADLVAGEAIRQGRRFEFLGVNYDSRRTGFLLADGEILKWFENHDESVSGKVVGNPPDHILLWRMLAHGLDRSFPELAVLCEELFKPVQVRPAIPSDIAVLAPSGRPGARSWAPGYLYDRWTSDVARELGVSSEIAVARATELGAVPRKAFAFSSVGGDSPVTVNDVLVLADRNGIPAAAAADLWVEQGRLAPREVVDLAIAVDTDPVFLWKRSGKGTFWSGAQPGGEVAPGLVARSSQVLGISVDQVCAAMARHGLAADPTGLPPFPSDTTVALLSWGLDGSNPWLRRADVVPAGHLLQAARDLGIAVERAVEVLGGAGFRLARVPGDACAEDLELFCEGRLRWHDVARLTYQKLFELRELRKSSLREVIERYGAYGFEIPIVLPETLTRLDRELFSPDGAMDWDDLLVADPVPFARLIMAARTLKRHPAELARHLRTRGILPSCDDLPTGLSTDQAVDLLSRGSSFSVRLLWIGDLDLADLLKVSLRTGHPMAQIAGWFRAWGIEVPDVAELIRDALARVPTADADPS